MPKKSLPPRGRLWLLRQGTSQAKVRAMDYAGAVKRGKEIGFHNPDAIVLQEELRKNPVQRRSAANVGRTRYIRRPSQITKAKPTKRLRKRRGKNYDRPTKGRFPNPTRKGFIICIKKGNGPKMHYDGEKFSQRRPRTFPTQAAAKKQGLWLMSTFRVLKKYRVTVEPNF